MDRLNDVPPLKELATEVEAHYYNRVRLALRRLGRPIRIALPSLRHLDLVVTEAVWVCVDRDLQDLPVLAWSDFPATRTALHAPVPCRLRVYHQHAERILPTVLAEADTELARRLGTS